MLIEQWENGVDLKKIWCIYVMHSTQSSRIYLSTHFVFKKFQSQLNKSHEMTLGLLGRI